MKQTYNVGYLQTPSVKHLANVKQALADTGLASLTTPNEMLPEAIEEGLVELKPDNIRGGVKIGNVEGAIVNTIEDVNPSNYEKQISLDFTDIHYHSNGSDIYGSYSSSSWGPAGVFHYNTLTGEVTQIYSTGYGWSNFYEDVDGSVYCSTNSSSYKGILKLKGLTCSQVYSKNFKWSVFFYNGNGVTYVCSGAGYNNGILAIRNGNIKALTTTTGAEGKFYQTKDGDIYWLSDSSLTSAGKGIVLLQNEQAIIISTDATDVEIMEHQNKKYLLSYNLGILKLDGTTLTTLYEYSGIMGIKQFVSSDDTLYINAGNKTVFSIKNEEVKLIYEGSIELQFMDKNNKIYGVSSTSVYCIDGDNISTLAENVTSANYYKVWFETTKGDLYASHGSYSSGVHGILHIKNNVVSFIDDVSVKQNWVFFDDVNENVYAVCHGTHKPLILEGSTYTLIGKQMNFETDFSVFKTKDGTVVTNKILKDNSKIFLFKDKSMYTLVPKND